MTDIPFLALKAGEVTPLSGFLQEGNCGKSLGDKVLENTLGSSGRAHEASKTRAVRNFQAVGFGPTRTANYQSGLQTAQYRASDVSKWARNWAAKMRE